LLGKETPSSRCPQATSVPASALGRQPGVLNSAEETSEELDMALSLKVGGLSGLGAAGQAEGLPSQAHCPVQDKQPAAAAAGRC